ncbi:MAG: glycosyltransferase family 4 protein [Rhodospirillaceae bacterium]|nr:glycosyltransferase family 4 protein [Rhodospirillaceae bacterium]
MRILTFSSLYPNREQPIHGVFVENRLRHLLKQPGVSSEVVAPVPWFPLHHAMFGEYAKYARIPSHEVRHGIDIHHPRFALIPRVGMSASPSLMAAGTLGTVRKLIRGGQGFDLIDAHYFYPDGVAAVILGRMLNVPVVITGRGTDLNLIPNYRVPRAQIQWAARHAAGMITVCDALKDSLIELGVAPDRVAVLRNGVDTDVFKPLDRHAARQRFGITGPAIASVGGLIERKGHHHIIAAMPTLPEFTLFIAGNGPNRPALAALSSQLNVSDRVRFLGAIAHAELRDLYEAVDVLVLASSREGWANVLLESMACGTPVVASNIWGTPEVVQSPTAGVLLPAITPDHISASVRALLADPPDRAATVNYARQFTWSSTSQGQIALFNAILARTGAGN